MTHSSGRCKSQFTISLTISNYYLKEKKCFNEIRSVIVYKYTAASVVERVCAFQMEYKFKIIYHFNYIDKNVYKVRIKGALYTCGRHSAECVCMSEIL